MSDTTNKVLLGVSAGVGLLAAGLALKAGKYVYLHIIAVQLHYNNITIVTLGLDSCERRFDLCGVQI